MRRIAAFLLLSLLAGLGFVSLAQAQERLRPLGEVTYAPKPPEAQVGVYRLSSRENLLRAFRFYAEEGSVELIGARLIYRDGTSERIRINQKLREGTSSTTIRTRDPKPLREIEITYMPIGQVTILLEGDAREAEPVLQWSEVGCKNVGFLVDRDVISISSRDLYSALRLRTRGFDIEMIDLGVRYGNGESEIYPLRTIIRGGGTTQAIKLRGELRRISQIELVYRSRALSTQKTSLCVDGLKSVE